MRNFLIVASLRLLSLLTLSLLYLKGLSQTGNTCGVSASFTPANDSVATVGTVVTFTSTSTNSSTYQWFVNGLNYFNAAPTFNYAFSTGTYEIMMVAANGTCTDTVRATYFCPGTPYPTDTLSVNNYGFSKSDETTSVVDDTREGGFIIGGTSRIYTMPNFIALDRAYVVKTKPGGCVEWSQMITDSKGGTVDAVLGCADSSVLVSGAYYGGGYYLTRFGKTGIRLWQNSFSTAGTSLNFVKLAEDDGSFYGLTYWASQSAGPFRLVKFDANGNVVWTRSYDFSSAFLDFGAANGLTVVNHQVYISGSAYFGGTNGQPGFNKNFIIRVDGLSGQTVWVKQYTPAFGTSYFAGIKPYGSRLMVSATAGAFNNRIGHSVLIIDEAGNFVKGTTVLHQDNNASSLAGYFSALNGVAEADTAKNIYLLNWITRPLSLQPNTAISSYFLKLDSSFNFIWGRTTGGIGTRQYIAAAMNNKNEWGCVTTDFNLVEYGGLATNNYRLLKIKGSPAGYAGCSSGTNGFDFLPLSYTTAPMTPTIDTIFATAKQTMTFPFSPVYTESRYACPDFIDSCVLLKTSGPASICNLSQTYTYKVFRNKKCNLPVQWEVSGGVMVIAQNDSLIKVRFPAFGTYSIAAKLLSSCNPKKDSVLVTVASRTLPLELGTNKQLCIGNTVKLSAGPKYLTYLWQDGSVDSIFTAVQTGTYWVKVSDSCGNEMSDTIEVLSAPPIPFTLGPDRTKCNADTLHLSAPTGFLAYTWSNNYNISSTNTQNVIVNPLVDTAYFVKAEKTPGCFAYDTVRINVFTSPPINLGSDVSFCAGDSGQFNAGPGFQTYAWSNGANTQSITVKTAGSYSVTGITAAGCKSFDTVRVANVYPLPLVNLDKGMAICLGSSKTLNAGNFASYQWNTGATSSSISVSNIGTYAVLVTDANGCEGSDTTSITTIYPLPKNFLPVDTAICSYGTIELSPTTTYNRYLWSNGAATRSITIAQPGAYWLEVTDANTCKGRDSMVVNPKDCLKGFYIPNAFTPNRDGRNDLFRPLLFGIVKQYRFIVFNRWGEIVYQTTELQKGWNGAVQGSTQDTGVFVWTCTYQLEGENVKTEKGTVTLIR